MKYYIDTEFIEGFHKPLFGKKRHFIDMISIGIVCEDGREYYAISNEFNPKDADQWVKSNVISNLYTEDGLKLRPSDWKSNKQIAEDIKQFVFPKYSNYDLSEKMDYSPNEIVLSDRYWMDGKYKSPEFYAYYADYDWVLFCSLFGRMIDLPKGFPMYCRDLKQMLDEKAGLLTHDQLNKISHPGCTHDVLAYMRDSGQITPDYRVKIIKQHPNYPAQKNEHNALDDARWNKKLHDFILSL